MALLGVAIAVSIPLATSHPAPVANPQKSHASHQTHAGENAHSGHSRSPAPIPSVNAGLVTWKLATPLSRMVVEPSSGPNLTVLGGYSGGASAGGVYDLDTADGKLSQVGYLAVPTHDAGGAVIDGRNVLFGGGNTTSDAVVQALTPGSALPTAAVTGQLPEARSDCVGVSIGDIAYVVGGYNGSSGDSAVLATADGVAFRSAANVPVPVRYPAVSTLGGLIYLFGGEAIGGPDNGRPVADIQVVDPQTGTARVLGTMPEALEGASAVTLDGHVYIAGGDTASSGAAAPTSSATIWAFEPSTGKMLHAGALRVAVSYAGFAVLGTTAWLVGGESNGVATSAVQMFRTNPDVGAEG